MKEIFGLLMAVKITPDIFYKKVWANFYLCSLSIITIPAIFLYLSTLERDIPKDPAILYIMKFMLIASLFAAIPLYNFILRKNTILKKGSNAPLEKKMMAYIAIMITGLSNAFMPCIIGGMLSMFAEDIRFASAAILSAALFYYLRPTKERIIRDMNLAMEERHVLFGGM